MPSYVLNKGGADDHSETRRVVRRRVPVGGRAARNRVGTECDRRNSHRQHGRRHARCHGRGRKPRPHREGQVGRSPTDRAATRSSICVLARTASATACPGFTTAVRDGLFLPADFTATVNIQLSVGALEESVTVTGQNPAGGRAVVRADRGDHAQPARCAADAPQHAVVRLPGAGRAAEQAGRRRRADDGAGQHARARREPAAHDDADRRHAGEPGVQRRRSFRTTSTRRPSRRRRSRRARKVPMFPAGASAST